MSSRLQRTALAAALLVLVAQPLSADVPLVEFPPVSNNAALQYWQAFAMLPALDEKQEKLLDDRATAAIDADAVKLLDSAQTSFMFMTRAAKLRECDWGLDYRDGAQMYLPHLNKARTLARLAALDARRAFEAGQYDRGGELAFGMVAMGRQVGGDHTLVSMLVCYMIEGMMVDAVAPYVPELGASYGDSLTLAESLPPSPPLAHGVQCEKRLASTIVGQLKEKEDRHPGSWRGSWKALLGETEDPIPDVKSFDELVKLMEGFESTYDELAQLATLPWHEFDEKYPNLVKSATADNPIAKIFMPAMDKVVAAQRHSEARLAMLLAAVAVVEGGSEKLAAIKDPFGDGPFEYRKLDTGFELASKLQKDGKPVTLVIGQKPRVAKP
jgi:hypothetical protein